MNIRSTETNHELTEGQKLDITISSALGLINKNPELKSEEIVRGIAMRFSDEVLNEKYSKLKEIQDGLQQQYRLAGDAGNYSKRLLELSRKIEIVKGFMAINLDQK